MALNQDIFKELDSIETWCDAVKEKVSGLRKKLIHFHGGAPRKGKTRQPKVISDAVINEVLNARLKKTFK